MIFQAKIEAKKDKTPSKNSKNTQSLRLLNQKFSQESSTPQDSPENFISVETAAVLAKQNQVIILPTHSTYIAAIPASKTSSVLHISSAFPQFSTDLPHVLFSSIDQLKQFTKSRPSWVDMLLMVFQDDISIQLESHRLPGVSGTIVACISTHPTVCNFFALHNRPLLFCFASKAGYPPITDSQNLNCFTVPSVSAGRCRTGVIPTRVADGENSLVSSKSSVKLSAEFSSEFSWGVFQPNSHKSAPKNYGSNQNQTSNTQIIDICSLGTVSAAEISTVLPWARITNSMSAAGVLHNQAQFISAFGQIPPRSTSTILGTLESFYASGLVPLHTNFHTLQLENKTLINLGSQTDWRQIVGKLYSNFHLAFNQNTDFYAVLPFSLHSHLARLIAQECLKYGKNSQALQPKVSSANQQIHQYFQALKHNLT